MPTDRKSVGLALKIQVQSEKDRNATVFEFYRLRIARERQAQLEFVDHLFCKPNALDIVLFVRKRP